MRIESSVTSVSWIPSEAITGLPRLPFEFGVTHYDDPPPAVLGDLGALASAGRFRFANELRAWIEVAGDAIVDAGYTGGGHIGATTLHVAALDLTVPATAYPELRPQPEHGDGWVRFGQTTGGRTGAPAPRRVDGPPVFKIEAPIAWTTLALVLYVDGRVEHQLVGASSFPRHWLYDADGVLVAKSGFIDFETWYRHATPTHSPWGDEDAPALVTEPETGLERYLSTKIMRGGRKPHVTRVRRGEVIMSQGEPGTKLVLVLDGLVAIDVDATTVAEAGPGAVLGERAILEGGRRTSTVRALTNCTLAVADGKNINRQSLARLSAGHHREERPRRS